MSTTPRHPPGALRSGRAGTTNLADLASAAAEHAVADAHQGQVFLGILHRESDSVAAALTAAETCARIERGSGSTAAAQRYEAEARRLRAVLRELDGMMANLRSRFPAAS